MTFFEKVIQSAKYIAWQDALAPFIFIFVLPVAIVYKIYLNTIKSNLWLISEGKNDAKDNGYVLFRYIRSNHPAVNVHYAISTKSASYSKVRILGNVVPFGSFKHWIYYIAATKNISNHKASGPNAPLLYVLHKYNLLNGHRVFLQHGVTMNNVTFLHYSETKFDLFICGAAPEYEYVRRHFGYPTKNVSYLGFPRFDDLWGATTKKNQIVIMPTWRNWLGRETNALSKKKDFTHTSYFKKYQSVLNNNTLINYIERHNIEIYFYPHVNMQRFIKYFSTKSHNIKIVTARDSNIQSLISESALMISDYSSVTIDFAYMGKPLIYYQFDKAEFEKKQYAKGYFDYNEMGFGPVIQAEAELVRKVIDYYDKGLVIESNYLRNADDFFKIRDASNSKRVYEKILELDKSEKIVDED